MNISGVRKVHHLAEYLAQLTKKVSRSGDFGTKDGGFPWDTEKKTRSWTYYNGIMMDGFLMLDKDAYGKDVNAFYHANITEDGQVDAKNLTSEEDNRYRENELDSIPPARALFKLIRYPDALITEADKQKYIRLIRSIYDVMSRYEIIPETNGNYLHKMKDRHWKTYPFALDGLYMAQPFFMEIADALACGFLKPSDFYPIEICSDLLCRTVAERMAWAGKALYDKETHLYHHGWGPDGIGVNGVYWLRAVGWYAAALADVISMMPDEMADKELLIENEKKLFDGMMEYQDPSFGMWYNVISHGPGLADGSGNRLESSGSSLMAYAMMKSYSEGYVGDSYGEAGLRAFNGTVMNQLEEKKDGSFTLHNVYIASGVETEPAGYLKNGYRDNEAKGVGPLMMAASYAKPAADLFHHKTQ